MPGATPWRDDGRGGLFRTVYIPARITVRSACAFALRCFTGYSNCGSIPSVYNSYARTQDFSSSVSRDSNPKYFPRNTLIWPKSLELWQKMPPCLFYDDSHNLSLPGDEYETSLDWGSGCSASAAPHCTNRARSRGTSRTRVLRSHRVHACARREPYGRPGGGLHTPPSVAPPGQRPIQLVQLLGGGIHRTSAVVHVRRSDTQARS